MGKLISVLRFLKMPLGGVLLFLLGVAILTFVAPTLLRAYHTQTWPSVVGKVVESGWHNAVVGQNASTTRPTFRFLPKIEYSYTIGAKEYRGTTVAMGSAATEVDRELAKGKLQIYSLGRAVQVYYNPDKPEISCLEQEKPSLSNIMGVILGIVFFYGAFMILRQSFQMNA